MEPRGLREIPTSHAWNRIAVIQWLPPSDRKRTGDELCDFLQRFRRGPEAKHDIWFRDVSSAEGFLDALAELVVGVEREGKLPILHLETHGSPSGIGSDEDSFLSWADLREPLIRLNRATRFNLFVVMAACDGARLFETLDPGKAAPCWALLGPLGPVYEHRIASVFPAFYAEYLESHDGQKAMRALASEEDPDSPPWLFLSASFGFRYFFALFMASTLGLTPTIEMNAAILQEIAQSKWRLPSSPLSTLEGRLLERSPGVRERVEAMQKAYYMTDTLPENESLFMLELAALADVKVVEQRLALTSGR